MSPTLEFESKNIEKAIDLACKETNISRGDLKYEVLSDGSSGIFGLVGAKKAKIRVILPDSGVPQDHTREGVQSLVDEAFNEGSAGEYRKDETSATKQEKFIYRDEKESTKFKKSEIPEESISLGREALQRIVDFITTDAKISVRQDNGRLLYFIEGGNSAILIGKRGQNLDAIQYLVDKIINKHIDHRIRVQVDVEGYLETRRKSLTKLATKMAEKAKRTGKPATIGQMNAHDRRIVHLALKSEKGVRTQSMGDGQYRKLVVFPKRQNRKRY